MFTNQFSRFRSPNAGNTIIIFLPGSPYFHVAPAKRASDMTYGVSYSITCS